MKRILLISAAVLLMFVFFACTENESYNEPIYSPTAPPETELPPYDEDEEWPEWPTIIIDGVGLEGSYLANPLGEIFPTHIPLEMVANALGATVESDDAGYVSVISGFNGDITFTPETNVFYVEGEAVELQLQAYIEDDVIYVPIAFFRDVFGAGSATLESGEVHIRTHLADGIEDDMS